MTSKTDWHDFELNAALPLRVYNTLTLVAPRISSAYWLHTLLNSGNAMICKHCNEYFFEGNIKLMQPEVV